MGEKEDKRRKNQEKEKKKKKNKKRNLVVVESILVEVSGSRSINASVFIFWYLLLGYYLCKREK